MAFVFLSSIPLIVALYFNGVRAATGPVTDLHVVNRNVSPDGYSRPAVLAGGTFPGPVLKGNKVCASDVLHDGDAHRMLRQGDNFRITVFDDLTNADMLTDTSIVCGMSKWTPVSDGTDCHLLQHWHGFFQHDTNWADGPAFITQCPITSGHSFDYNFQVPDQAGEPLKFIANCCCVFTPYSSGTFWYHSHLSTQYCDGLRGPLIVYDPHDPQAHLYDIDDGMQ